jgi:2-keto-4-pentenoate hydratase/2-oxohepta-3-ene-1,7-dioic acid hydratase in catechol pathway
MKFLSYRSTAPGNATADHRLGVVSGSQIFGLTPGVRLLDLLGDDGERLHLAGEGALADPVEVLAYDGADIGAPIPTPPTIRDFMTFEKHLEGVSRRADPTATVPQQFFEQPVFYFTNPHAVIGPNDDVPMPPGCHLFDFELEAAAVVGRAGYNLSPGEAEPYIAGYMILNDWSARDVQMHEMLMRLGPAKGKDTATTLGPLFVTADELAPYRSGTSFDLGMQVSVNGNLVGIDRWNNMYWSYAELLAYASRGTWVRPGDVIGSGTCGNGGCLAELWGRNGLDSHAPLSPGDVVSLTIDHLGTTQNTVVPGAPLIPLR